MPLQILIANEILAANNIGGIKGGNKSIEKCKKLSRTRKLLKNLKLSKSRNLKAKKLFKFPKSAKSKKKLLKNRDLFYFNAKKNGPSFLTFNAKTTFNYLQLTFTKTLIL